jgi:predicted DNA-binding protein (MmcQ/YjbR family)
MNIEELRERCLAVKGAIECMPFDEDTMVYKVMGKMFAFFSLTPKEGGFWVNMKCHPDKSVHLREHYQGIIPGYHSDKRYWITVYIQSDVPDRLIAELITHSIEEVIKKLPKYKRIAYQKPKQEENSTEAATGIS